MYLTVQTCIQLALQAGPVKGKGALSSVRLQGRVEVEVEAAAGMYST